MKLRDVAQALGAQLTGDGEREILGVAGMEDAGPEQLTFLANPKYAALARTTKAAAVLVDPKFPALDHTATLHIQNPYLAFARAIELFYQPPRYEPGIDVTARIHASAKLGKNAHVGAYVVIAEDAVVGDDAVLLPHAVLYRGVHIGDRFFAHAHSVVREHCQLGDDVTLQNGAIVGSDGFGFAQDSAKQWIKIVQSGRAVLGNAVEVQANACIDRASVGETVIGDGAKVDNLVQVGHGSKVGDRTLLCSQVGLAGSTNVGKDVILAGQVGVAGHLTIGDGAIATAQTGIPNDVAPRTVVSGYPAIENRHWLRQSAVLARLPETIRELRAAIKALQKD